MAVIKVRQSMAGVNFALAPGDVVEWDDADAERLVNAGFAEYDGRPPKPRQVSPPEPESADTASSDDDAGEPDAEKPKATRRKSKSKK